MLSCSLKQLGINTNSSYSQIIVVLPFPQVSSSKSRPQRNCGLYFPKLIQARLGLHKVLHSGTFVVDVLISSVLLSPAQNLLVFFIRLTDLCDIVYVAYIVCSVLFLRRCWAPVEWRHSKLFWWWWWWWWGLPRRRGLLHAVLPTSARHPSQWSRRLSMPRCSRRLGGINPTTCPAIPLLWVLFSGCQLVCRLRLTDVKVWCLRTGCHSRRSLNTAKAMTVKQPNLQ